MFFSHDFEEKSSGIKVVEGCDFLEKFRKSRGWNFPISAPSRSVLSVIFGSSNYNPGLLRIKFISVISIDYNVFLISLLSFGILKLGIYKFGIEVIAF